LASWAWSPTQFMMEDAMSLGKFIFLSLSLSPVVCVPAGAPLPVPLLWWVLFLCVHASCAFFVSKWQPLLSLITTPEPRGPLG
jgi:hypothetical protein